MSTFPEHYQDTEMETALNSALQHCEKERIHQINSIQPHGVLVALDTDNRVVFCSANAGCVFAYQITELLGTQLSTLISPKSIKELENIQGLGEWRSTAVIRLEIINRHESRVHDAAISWNAPYRLLEIEIRETESRNLYETTFVPARDLLWQLDNEQDLTYYTQKVTECVRQTTGYDRVMLYKFDLNWDGEVIAESRVPDARSYLGNRFPASDIPAQARALYTRNLIRVIADVHAQPALIHANDKTEEIPLDLTYSVLRSLSPVHLEYLGNMGVTATLTISLIHNGKLWGMLACHHHSPKQVSLRERELYELIGKTISVKLSDLQRIEETEIKEQARQLLNDLKPDRLDSVSEDNAQQLMAIMEANGIIICNQGRHFAFGKTPSDVQLHRLENVLRQQQPQSVFHTDELSGFFAEATDYSKTVSGILLAPLNETLDNYLMWCRSASTITLNWAGQPHKEINHTQYGYRISPRQSFENWIQTYNNKSAPWSSLQIELAADLATIFLQHINLTHEHYKDTLSQQFENLIRLSNSLYMQLDAEDKITQVSPSSEKITGYTSEDLNACCFTDIFHTDYIETFQQAKHLLCCTQQPQKLVIPFNHPDGRCVWAELQLHPNNHHGKPEFLLITGQDITQRHHYQMALEELHERNALRLNAKNDGIFNINTQGRISYINTTALSLLGYQSDTELTGADCHQLLQPSDQNGAYYSKAQSPLLLTLSSGEEKESITDQFQTQSGSPLAVGYKAIPIKAHDMISGVLVVFRPRAQLFNIPEKQVDTHTAILNKASEAIMITDTEGKILSVNRAFTTVTGYSEEEVQGKKPSYMSSGIHTSSFYRSLWSSLLKKDEWKGEIWNRRKNGEIYPFKGSISVVRDDQGKICHYLGVFSDYSKAKQAQDNLLRARNYDALTGLPNRQYSLQLIQQRFDAAKTGNHRLALILIDIDSFKLLNDTQGHEIGDQFLQTIANRLADPLPHSSLLCRWGSDEFMLLLDHVQEQHSIAEMTQKLFNELSRPFLLPQHEVIPSACAGISCYPEDADNPQGLIQAADTALLRAKQSGPASINFFTKILADQIHRKFEIANELRRAVRNNELELHFQPQVNNLSGALDGVEALIRWNHPSKGMIPPVDFIPLAEELNLIEMVGDWVLNSALRQMAHWINNGTPIPRVAVNIAPQQLSDGFIERVSELLARYAVPAQALELEITEGAFERSEAIIQRLHQLRQLGIALSIDDFGTGYSSLAHLKHLPVNCFKVDKAFIDGLPDCAFDVAILQAVVTLGKSLNIHVLAEGVENAQQLEFLKQNHVHSIQGYYFGQPMNTHTLEQWIQSRYTESDPPNDA